jgi:tetratricopeptide (TPR) repeat protein
MLLRRLIATLAGNQAKRPRRARGQALLDKGESFLKDGDIERAKLCYTEALRLDDDIPVAHAQLALLLTAAGRLDEALPHFRVGQAATHLVPEFIESYVRVLLQRGGHEEARIVAESAVRTHSAHYESWFSRGLAELACSDHEQALASFDRALALRPESADAHANRGIALQNAGRLTDALAEFERALQLNPRHALARFHRSLVLLARGEYAAAWPEYETRLQSADLGARPQHFPRWNGTDPAGQGVLVYGEQGLGDEIMFASCLPDLIGTGARCIVECHPKLQQLFERSFPNAAIYASLPDKRVPEDIRAIRIDWEVPIASLPLFYRRSIGEFPNHEQYLRADTDRSTFWRTRLAELGHPLKVGISWRGGSPGTLASSRSIPLDEWLPILEVPGVKFVSLQYTPDAAQALKVLAERHGIDIAHWPQAISNYDETAALVSVLDLTISVSTSIVHLAGALGRPVWVMLPSTPEWRYGQLGDRMPWHPSARLFRQRREGDWMDVISSVAEHLRQRVTSELR